MSTITLQYNNILCFIYVTVIMAYYNTMLSITLCKNKKIANSTVYYAKYAYNMQFTYKTNE